MTEVVEKVASDELAALALIDLEALEAEVSALDETKDGDILAAIRGGGDLTGFAESVEAELENSQRSSIQDFMESSEDLAALHKEINVCDNVLARMEQMLLSFQTDLGSILLQN